MDSNRIKGLALGAREALVAEVSARLGTVLAAGSTERLSRPDEVARLERAVRERGRDEVVESAAYTWFNRLCALRFMDANRYTATPVVTPRPGTTQPAVLADAAAGVFDPGYAIGGKAKARVSGILSGAVPSENAGEAAYAELLSAVCRHYAGPMPYLFSEGAASDLLMPQGLLAEGSILSRIVSELDDDECSSVEVLGWLYQFYISERKNEFFNSKRKATREDIAPATQLFTPEWIVRFLSENSLGRLWMLNNPNSGLATSMEYYVAPGEGDDTEHLEVASAEEIKVLDPACGSGHILVYCFDLLFRMYEEEGWLPEDIPQMILENNLYGLEIDRRAAEIATFALEMKARERDPRFLDKNVDAHVTVLEPATLTPQELALLPQLAERRSLLNAMSHMDEAGSLYVPGPSDIDLLKEEIGRLGGMQDSIFAAEALAKCGTMLEDVEALSGAYDVVVANPPYMGSGKMDLWLNGWLKDHYEDEKSDLFAAFVVRNAMFAKPHGELGFMTPYVWMFISSYEKLRLLLIEEKTITSLIQLEYSGFAGATVPICTFTVNNAHLDGYEGGYVRLSDFVGADRQAPKALEAIKDPDCGWFYRRDADSFKDIPGSPIAYWASEGVRRAFRKGRALKEYAQPRKGLGTGQKNLFLRGWWEPSLSKICFCSHNGDEASLSGLRWFPTNKGGSYRKWYGNNEYVVDWQNDGERIRGYRNAAGNLAARPQNIDFYFKECITWSKISSGGPSFRYQPYGFIFNEVGPAFFGSHDRLLCLQALLNSTVISPVASILSPTLDFEAGQVAEYPVFHTVIGNASIPMTVECCIDSSKLDWDSFETSWDFRRHPLLNGHTSLSEAAATIEAEWQKRFDSLKSNEEELNRIFAKIYDLEGEVPIEVPDDKVSVRRFDLGREVRSLVSYGVGCMFGRYSIDRDGLVLADQGSTLADFREKVPDATFVPDPDDVLPILDGEWFEDDIVTGFRRWLAAAFGDATLDENVRFIEDALGKDLRTYFIKDFYADHLKVYQKRPIYWLFQSPKKGFSALVYMHRYDASTVGTILSRYLREYEDKIRRRLTSLEAPDVSVRDQREATRLRSRLVELEGWERDVIYPLAQKHMPIDLDDGIKANYNKFPRALAKVSGLSDWR